MEAEGLLQCSQDPTTGPYTSPLQAVHTLPPYFPKIHSSITL
jgi:hypothetical protein